MNLLRQHAYLMRTYLLQQRDKLNELKLYPPTFLPVLTTLTMEGTIIISICTLYSNKQLPSRGNIFFAACALYEAMAAMLCSSSCLCKGLRRPAAAAPTACLLLLHKCR